MNNIQKRVLAVHDISCVGRCSLTVALPIISAAGIETACLPTAVLSTHTGGFEGFTYRDLTEDMLPISAHWKSLGQKFDAIYTGFLGSFGQLDIIKRLFAEFGSPPALKILDPVIADHGKLYKIFDMRFVAGMVQLAKDVDLIIPNITEACFLLGKTYSPPPYAPQFIESLLDGLLNLGAKSAVLTGVSFAKGELGAACKRAEDRQASFAFTSHIEGEYHGTGDVFASTLTAALLRGFSLERSMDIAVKYTYRCIKRTLAAGTDVRYGVHFELEMPYFLSLLEGGNV